MSDPLIGVAGVIDYAHGADNTLTVVIQTNGVADVITGRSYKAEIRADQSATSTAEAVHVCTVTDGPNGTVTLTIATAAMAALTVGKQYYADLRDITGGASLPPLVRWQINVVQEVTK